MKIDAFKRSTVAVLFGVLWWLGFAAVAAVPADSQDAADRERVFDVVDAVRGGLIEVEANGGGITAVHARVRRLTSRPFLVRFPAGSMFVAGNSRTQNMVTTATHVMRLPSTDWQHITVPAACANLPRAVPGRDDKFSVRRLPAGSDLARAAERLNASMPYAVRQAAVWIVTDNASYASLGKLVSRSGTGSSWRTIREDDAVTAMRLLSDSGIDVKRRAIWRDRAELLRGVKNEQLREWLTRQ